MAWFYYKDELTQDEIARRLSVSRASVGRMLDRARKVGLVSISLNADHLGAFEVSRQLRQTFALAEALVIPDHETQDGDHHELNARLGLGGAQFMSTHLRPGGTLGVGWGETVSRVIASTSFGAVGPIHMVSLTGGVDAYLPAFLSSKGEGAGRGGDDQRHGHPDAHRRLHPRAGRRAEGRARDPVGAQAGLRRRPGHRRGRHADRRRDHRADGLPGGRRRPDAARPPRGRGTSSASSSTPPGRVVKLPIHDRRIGIELADLAQIPKVTGVAGGLHKVDAILGALRGGFLDVLVTNELTALRLLELEGGGMAASGESRGQA